jgi:hypothetical protein
MIRSPIAQFQCLFAQPWSQAFVYLGGPLLYNRLHEIADQERGMRQIPSLGGPLKASRRLLGLVWRSAGWRTKGLPRIESP